MPVPNFLRSSYLALLISVGVRGAGACVHVLQGKEVAAQCSQVTRTQRQRQRQSAEPGSWDFSVVFPLTVFGRKALMLGLVGQPVDEGHYKHQSRVRSIQHSPPPSVLLKPLVYTITYLQKIYTYTVLK